MESIHKNGKIFKGKLASVMIKIGLATPLKKELTAKEVAEKIVLVESLEDLKEYESDKRQVVKAAYNKKLKELN